MGRATAIVQCITALLLLRQPGASGGRNLPEANSSDIADLDAAVPRLTNATLQLHLEAVATPGRELIFTTTSAWTPEITEMLQHFMWHLQHVGRDRNLMVISQDAGTCRNLVVCGPSSYHHPVSPPVSAPLPDGLWPSVDG